MEHRGHCSFCGSNMNNGVCSNHRCGRVNNELHPFPWSRCHCGDRMYSILSFSQLLRVSWLGILGVICFIISYFTFNVTFSILGIAIVIFWFIQRGLVHISIELETKLISQRLYRDRKLNGFDPNTASADEKKAMKDESDKVKAWEAFFWGIRIFQFVITILILLTITSAYSLYFLKMPTIADHHKTTMSRYVNNIPNRINLLTKNFRRMIHWEETNIKRLHWVLQNRGFSDEEIRKIVNHAQSLHISVNKVVDIVKDTNKCIGGGLFDYLQGQIDKIAENSKQEELISFPSVSERQIKVKTSGVGNINMPEYLKKLNKITVILAVIISICLALLELLTVITGVIALVSAVLYFVQDEAHDLLRADLFSLLEGKKEKKDGVTVASRGRKGLITSGLFVGLTRFIVNAMGKRR